jgi:hypothetical protein
VHARLQPLHTLLRACVRCTRCLIKLDTDFVIFRGFGPDKDEAKVKQRLGKRLPQVL